MNLQGNKFFMPLAFASAFIAVHGQPAQPPAYFLQKDSVQIGEIDQHYHSYGQGTPLLLIHGLTDTWRIWLPYIESLGSSHLLLIPDIRGHGKTTNPAPVLTPDQIAKDMFDLLDTLDLGRVQIAGYSFGGHVALRMAALQPERVEAMVVIAGAHRLLSSAKEFHQEALRTELSASWWLTEASKLHPNGEKQIQEIWKMGIESALSGDFVMSDKAIAAISARTLVIQGDRDEVFPLEVPLELYKSIKESQLWIIPNATHMAVFWEDLTPEGEQYTGNREANRLFPEIVNNFLGSFVPPKAQQGAGGDAAR